jgi:protein-S-isoprenylcysteine O-methyltransferase Ste14
MNLPVLLLLTLNFAVIGLLPKLFFRSDGRLNLRWWLTALPFWASPLLLLVAAVTDLRPLTPRAWDDGLSFASVVVSVGSLAVLFLTLGTHRIPISLWHQDDDAPQHLVTWGPYRFVRHPFYASFLLAFLAAFVYFPHWGTFVSLAYGLVALNLTGAREERRLSASEFGAEYRRYLARTGRFVPRIGRTRPTAGAHPASSS